MNAQSSRSHAILQIHMEQLQPSAAANQSMANSAGPRLSRSTLTFVDLAGSERLNKSKSEVCGCVRVVKLELVNRKNCRIWYTQHTHI